MPKPTTLTGHSDGARLRALRAGKYLYIQAPDRELYDQTSDPGEVRNLAESSKAVAGTLASQLADFRNKTSQTLVNLAKPDPEQSAKTAGSGVRELGRESGAGSESSRRDGPEGPNRNLKPAA